MKLFSDKQERKIFLKIKGRSFYDSNEVFIRTGGQNLILVVYVVTLLNDICTHITNEVYMVI